MKQSILSSYVSKYFYYGFEKFKHCQKKISSLMAWNEPNDKDPWNRNEKKGDEGPDLEKFIEQLKKIGAMGGRNGNQSSKDQGNSKFPILVITGLLGLWIFSGIYTVDAGKKGVELVFGKYRATTNPGLNWNFPKPIGSYQIINTENRFSQKIGTSNKEMIQGVNKESQMLTKDEALVDIQIEVQYQIKDPEKYWFSLTNPDATLKQVVESAIRERVGQTEIDVVLTSGRAQLMSEVKDLSQEILDKYQSGLIITNVNLQDAQAPNPVQPAFLDAISAREDEQRTINAANAIEKKIVLEAEGNAAKIINEAEAYRDSLIAEASGNASRFNQLYDAYKQAPEVTKTRLYIETMEAVLGQTSKVVMDESGNKLTILPLDQLMKTASDDKADQSFLLKSSSTKSNGLSNESRSNTYQNTAQQPTKVEAIPISPIRIRQ